MVTRLITAAIVMFLACTQVRAACEAVVVEGAPYTVCLFDPARERIEMFSLDANGVPFGNFAELAGELNGQNKTLRFAMNGGMYGSDLKPIGLYIEDGLVARKLNRRNGSGNFHLKPNGVFYVVDGGAAVADTDTYFKSVVKPQFATQSGPMLVINGKLHPRFSATGISKKIRNGVGVRDDGTVVFAISEGPVNFHSFATLFRDSYGCDNALFLDGSVSSLYAPELGRSDGLVPLGPMVGVVEMQ
jgi:uncharacterized protein YigE (DUF2233 family)